MSAMRLAVVRLAHYSAYRGDWLEIIRSAFCRPIIVNGATRSAARQQRRSGRTSGSHVDGMAIDARVQGDDAWDLHKIAIENGAHGIGVYQGGETPFEKRF